MSDWNDSIPQFEDDEFPDDELQFEPEEEK